MVLNLQNLNMNYVDVNNIIEKFSIGKRKYEEKKAKKLGYTSFYNYILDKVEGPKSEIFKEEKIQIIQSSNNKIPSKARLNILLENYKNGRYKEAEKLAVSITKDFPEYSFGWKVLGAVLGVLDRKSEGINAMQKAVALSPQDPEAHSNMGVTLKELGRLDEAEASYNQAIALKPDYAEAYSNLGVTLQELGRLDEAEASYNQAIALKPDYADAHYNLGLTLQQIGRLDEAEACYNQAIVLKPNFAQAFTNLGITLQELGRLDEAETSYNQAIVLMPNFAKTYCNLGVALKELGRLDEAEASFNQAIELKPDYAEAYLNLCELLENMNRADEILSLIRSISRKSFEKKADFLYYETLIEFQKENYEKAAKLVEKININELLIKRQPSALKLKGDIYHHKKNYKEAFEAYKSKNKRVKDSLEYKKQHSEKFLSQQLEKVAQIEQLQELSSYKLVIEPTWLQPTFLIGFPRSGTTLLDTILRTHTNINVLEELPMMDKMCANFRNIPTISSIEAMDNSAVETAVDIYFQELKKHTKVDTKQVIVDKLPLNIL